MTVDSAPTNSVTVTWTDPTVTGSQLPLYALIIWENDLTLSPPTQTNVGQVAPGIEEWSSGYVLPPGADRTYQVQAIDTGGNAGALSTASDAVTVATPSTPTAPGAPTGVSASLNP
jgi:hypothetical protein